MATVNGVAELWFRYKRWLDNNTEGITQSLNNGVNVHALEQLESKLTVRLPSSYREFYLLHDGQSWESQWAFPEGQWMPIEQTVTCYKQLISAGLDWPANWLPIIYDGGGGYLAISCKSDDESFGVLYDIWFEDNLREKIATSLEVWLAQLLDKIGKGLIYFDSDDGLSEHEM